MCPKKIMPLTLVHKARLQAFNQRTTRQLRLQKLAFAGSPCLSIRVRARV